MGIGQEFAWSLCAWIGLSLIAGALGSWFSMDGLRDWYPALAKPWFTPPSWVFGPVWTLLYVLMGIAAAIVSKYGDLEGRREALALFGTQLAFNAIWSMVFFGLRSPLLGLVVIAVLWMMIAACVYGFWQLNKAASVLMMPYLAWVSFASMLNLAIFQMNGG